MVEFRDWALLRRTRAPRYRRGGFQPEGDDRDPVWRQQPGQEGRDREVRPLLHALEAIGRRRVRQDLQERGHQEQSQPGLEEVHHYVS